MVDGLRPRVSGTIAVELGFGHEENNYFFWVFFSFSIAATFSGSGLTKNCFELHLTCNENINVESSVN